MEGDELTNFISEILAGKQYQDLDPEVREQMATDLKKELLDQIDRAIIDQLPDEKLDEFNALLDDPATTTQTLQEFIANSGVDVKNVSLRTMLVFRELYLEKPEGEY